jgi:hypothetical protein
MNQSAKKKTAEALTAREREELETLRARVIRPRRTTRAKRLKLPLEGVRKAFAKTQVEIARESGIQQADVSSLENKDTLDDVLVSTLRRYARALGGDLEIVVVASNGSRIVIEEGKG